MSAGSIQTGSQAVVVFHVETLKPPTKLPTLPFDLTLYEKVKEATYDGA